MRIEMIPAEHFRALQKKIQSNSAVAAGWARFEGRMREFDGPKLAELKDKWRMLDERAIKYGGLKIYTRGNYLRSMGYAMTDLAFHYRMTKAESSGKATQMIGNWIASEQRWLAQGAQNNWQADLWTADFAAAMGLGLNFSEEALPREDKVSWQRAIAEKGIGPILGDWVNPQTRIHALDSMGHNWWSVCVSGAAIALFAVRDTYPEADAWLSRIADSYIEFFNYPGNVLQNKSRTFGVTGEYIETLGYLDFTLHHALFLFDLYRDSLGRDLAAELPVLEKICDYYMANVEILDGKIYRPNFGNMGSGAASIGSYNHHPAQAWMWLANRFQRNDLFHLVKRTQPEPRNFLEFLYWPSDLDGSSFDGAPGCIVFESTGEAVLRDDYSEASTFFAIKTGETWNHNHADAGSFILSSHGREFIIDSGTSEYSNPLTFTYFKMPEAHNLILHDGRGQRDEIEFLGTKFKGTIPTKLFGADYRYLLADATGPWEGVYHRFYRHVLWLGDFIVMVDDLMASHVAPWTQLLHYQGRAETATGSTKIENQGKTLTVHHLFPEVEKSETRTGYLSTIIPGGHKYEYQTSEIPYLALHYAGKERREKFIQLFELPEGVQKRIEKIELPGISGVRVATAGDVWEIICNHDADGRRMHQNSPVAFGSLVTDAFLLVVRRSGDGQLRSLGIHNGSYVRAGGALLFNALLKSDIHFIYESARIGIESELTSPTWIDFATEEAPGSPRRIHLQKGPAVKWLER